MFDEEILKGGGIGAGIVALIVAVGRAFKSVSLDRRDVAKVNAEVAVIDLLRAEIARATERGERMEREIADLKQTVDDLREERMQLKLVVEELNRRMSENPKGAPNATSPELETDSDGSVVDAPYLPSDSHLGR